jgi:3-methyladenine DNA glycosylase AlkC
MEPLKEMFNEPFFKKLAADFSKLYPEFPQKKFLKSVLEGLADRSLNERMRHASVCLHDCLPDFPQAIEIILQVAPAYRGYISILFPDYVGQYGKSHPALSLKALKVLTTYGSAEFAIREFLRTDLKGTLAEMYKWSKDKDHHVRRLASEGSRPRLPWSFQLPQIASNPELIRPILEQLKNDPELYVRKSVANHLNDFSRIDPDWMLSVVSSWDLKDPNTAWIVKHACRTLIKKGDVRALKIFSVSGKVALRCDALKLSAAKIRLGQSIEFNFALESLSPRPQKLVIDYEVTYAKSGGKSSSKVFKLKEVQIPGKGNLQIRKKHAFADLSTRKHYPGKHSVRILVNGNNLAEKDFVLVS